MLPQFFFKENCKAVIILLPLNNYLLFLVGFSTTKNPNEICQQSLLLSVTEFVYINTKYF